MVKSNAKHFRIALMAGVMLLGLLASTVLAKGASLANEWAWGTNVGFFTLSPTNGGVTVYTDHLEGYIWGENIGWLRLGIFTGGGTHTYSNTNNSDYGVNKDITGNLSGYGWGTNIGWVKFNPTNGGVSIDPISGKFDGYAWSENIGWIHFEGSVPTAVGITAMSATSVQVSDAVTWPLVIVVTVGLLAVLSWHLRRKIPFPWW
jgi:hypothetical protein